MGNTISESMHTIDKILDKHENPLVKINLTQNEARRLAKKYMVIVSNGQALKPYDMGR